MLVLALDTCLNQCAVCLFDASGGKIVAEACETMERGHAEALAPMVQAVLQGWAPDRIAVTTGPGTFTGLRIGLCFARALGMARNIPVLGLDTLQALRLSDTVAQTLALASGQSGFAFVLEPGSQTIALRSISDIPKESLTKSHVNLADLAAWAATQTPGSMPDPVYIRQADAKPAVLVRFGGREAIKTAAHIHQQCFTSPWSEAEIAGMLQVAGTQLLIAEVAGEVSGFALVRTFEDDGEVLTIATLPTHRKLGVASKLIKYIAAKKMLLEVSTQNTAAIKLYTKFGFVEISRRKAYYDGGFDAIIMQRILL